MTQNKIVPMYRVIRDTHSMNRFVGACLDRRVLQFKQLVNIYGDLLAFNYQLASDNIKRYNTKITYFETDRYPLAWNVYNALYEMGLRAEDTSVIGKSLEEMTWGEMCDMLFEWIWHYVGLPVPDNNETVKIEIDIEDSDAPNSLRPIPLDPAFHARYWLFIYHEDDWPISGLSSFDGAYDSVADAQDSITSRNDLSDVSGEIFDSQIGDVVLYLNRNEWEEPFDMDKYNSSVNNNNRLDNDNE
jgi:hypothetical protein